MFFSILILAISLSIDSFGVGITYGVRNTKIPLFPKLILFFISFLAVFCSVYICNILLNFFPIFFSKIFGTFLLIIMGIFIIYQSQNKKAKKTLKPKVYNFFIKSLGITIKIIRNPLNSDLDDSKTIDCMEAIYLGIALSIDSICTGIGLSLLGTNSILFPCMVATCQIMFLSLGNILGKKIKSASLLPENCWSLLSGILLILIGLLKLF